MTTMTAYSEGQFSWVDLMSGDIGRAKTFYGGLFGWDAVDQDTQGGPPYAIFTKDGQSVAGLGQLGEEMKANGVPPCWNSYVTVKDVNAACAKVTELGGTVAMPPMQVTSAGHMAGLQDPTGAFLFLWQPIDHIGAQVVNEPNSFSWNDLATRDVEAAKSFFADLFGWTYEENNDSPAPYFVIENQGRQNGGIMPMNEEWGEMPPYWSTYFNVEDTDAAVAKVESLGGRLLMPPFDLPAGRMAVVADTDGAAFNVIKVARPD